MSDIKNIFNIGQSALQAAKTNIEVTAQNIAHVNTPGYNKKEVILATKHIPRGSPYPFHGVEVIGIKRAYQEELTSQIISQQEESAYWQTKQEYLSTLEEVFNESDELGLNSDLNQFWNAWQKLSTDPNSHEERQEVISSANQLAETFHSRAQNTLNILKNIKEDIGSVLNEINQILPKIAELNQRIGEAADNQAEEYKDQLDKLIEDVSQLVNINYWHEENGQITLCINGHPLVEGKNCYQLVSDVHDDGCITIQKRLADGTSLQISDRIQGGKLKGLLELNNEIIPDMVEKFDRLAFCLSQRVNELHQGGYGLDGTTGIYFFVPLASQNGAAQALALNPAFESNADLIAASSSPEIANNENALKLANLRQDPIITEGDVSWRANEYYSSFQRDIGRASKDSQTNTSHHHMILHNLQEKRSKVSDVALDEELANLIKFQQTYNASAKIISTADEMMSTLLNLKA